MAATGEDLQDLKAFLAIEGSDKDTDLKRLLDASWATAERITGQVLNRSLTTQTEAWFGEGGQAYYPQLQPVTAITSLTIDDTTIPASTGFGVSGYYLSGYAVRLRGYEFDEGSECSLVLTVGLSTPPEDLRQAVIELAAIKSATPGHLGQKSTTGMSKETTSWHDSDISPSILQVFQLYTLRLL